MKWNAPRRGKEAIIITEIPYQVNKAELVEQIAEMVKEKKIQGISDLRDESDRDGMRVYIELKRDATRDVVLNQLFKHSNLQTTFGVNLVALVGRPAALAQPARDDGRIHQAPRGGRHAADQV